MFSTSFGSSGSEAGQVSLASNGGVAVNETTHDVYVADTGNHRVDEFTSAGAFVRAWGWGVADGLPGFETCTLTCQAGSEGAEPGEFTAPTFVAVDNSGGESEGDVYVGDTGTNLVQKFTATGELVGSWATGGQLTGIEALSGIAVDPSGNLFASSPTWARLTSTVYEFSQDGTFEREIELEIYTGLHLLPEGMAVDGEDNLYVIYPNLFHGYPPVVYKFSPAGLPDGEVNGGNSTSGTPTGLAVDPSTNDIYLDEEEGGSITRYPYPCVPGGSNHGPEPCASSETFGSGHLSGAAGLAVDSSLGVVYAADTGDGRIDVFGPAPLVAPSIDSTSVVKVTSSSAELRARVNPNYYDTHAHFEYVADAAYQASGFSTATSVPISEVDLGAAGVDQSMSAVLPALQSGAIYHYRVVAGNGNGTVQVGRAYTFTTQPAAAASALPDGRAYELVSPADKGSGSLPGRADLQEEPVLQQAVQASANGERLGYFSLLPFSGAQAGSTTAYLAARGAGGWSSQDLIPSQATVQDAFLVRPRVAGYSEDLSKAVFEDGGHDGNGGHGQDSPPLVNGEPADNSNLFLRDNIGASYQLMDVTSPGVTPGAAGFEGASADYSHVVFVSAAQLTPEAIENKYNLYQWFGGAVSLVGQVPVPPATQCGSGGPPCIAAPQDASLGSGNTRRGGFLNSVSSDGSKIFFEDYEASEGSPHELFMRVDGARTVEVSASQKTNGSGPGGTDGNGRRNSTYWTAGTDGSEVFFTSCEQLTNDSTANSTGVGNDCENQEPGEFGTTPTGNDLYQYDTTSGALTDLTVDHSAGDPRGADVQGVLGTNDDGSYIYFVANGVLADGASPGDCRDGANIGEAPSGQCNLYLSHDGSTTFIARLDDATDRSDWDGESTARVTPDGTHLAFESAASLTGYDTTDALTGTPDSEVYEYDANTSRLVCASCNPSGAQPIGASTLDPVWGTTLADVGGASIEYLSRELSEDGSRVFFDSGDALVPGDVNGKLDVYEYEGGRPYLISSGTSNDESFFLDASASGDDVFFETRSQLVPQDTDEQFDIYDARVGGGFPNPPAPAPACVGESCKAAPVGGPAGQAPGSAGVSGVGNIMPSPAAVVVKSKSLTRAQRLAAALRVCRREPRRRQAACVARARRLYGPVRAGKATRRSGRGAK